MNQCVSEEERNEHGGREDLTKEMDIIEEEKKHWYAGERCIARKMNWRKREEKNNKTMNMKVSGYDVLV